jgi:predicted transcriptional regulator
MNQSDKYAEDIPEEVRTAISSVDNQIRQAILVLLHRNKELCFSEIQDELQIDKLKLNFHLKNLFSSALIDHYYKHEVGNQKYSYYAISQLGKRVLDSLIESFIPPSPVVKEVITSEPYQEYEMNSYLRNLVVEAFCVPNEKSESTATDSLGITTRVLQHRASNMTSRYVKTENR